VKKNIEGFPPKPCLICERRDTFHLRCRTYHNWVAVIEIAKVDLMYGKSVCFITPRGDYHVSPNRLIYDTKQPEEERK